MKKLKNKIVKKLNKTLKRVRLQFNVVKSVIYVNVQILRNSMFLTSVHPYAGFKIKNSKEVKEVRLGVLTFSQYVYQLSPRLHGFRLDSSYITTSWNMHRIPNSLTVGFIINPLWPVLKFFNYKAVKNMQNTTLGYGFITSALNSSKGIALSKILSRREKDVKPRKLTKFEKAVLSGDTKVITDGNGKVVKVITKGKKK